MLKRKPSPRACFLCLKAQAICDEKHPCGRCVSQGVSQMCYNSDSSNKRATPPSNSSTTTPSSSSASRTTARQVGFATDLLNSIPSPGAHSSTTDLRRAFAFSTDGCRSIDEEPIMTAQHKNDEIIGALVAELRLIREEQKQLHDEIRLLKQQNERLETRLSLSTFTKQLEANTSQLNVANGRIASSLASIADRLTPTNSSGNSPRQLSRSPTASQLQDTNIVSAMTSSRQTAATTTTTHTTAPASPPVVNINDDTGYTSHSPIVVFDLTTTPATVMSATDNFCKMMGYAMHEVTGMPWHKFIHPDYIPRTRHIFMQAHHSTTIQFYQVYKTKDGHIFHTVDTHKIFFGTDGVKPISDIVSIMLLPTPPPTTTGHMLSITDKEKLSPPTTHPEDNDDGPIIYTLNDDSSFYDMPLSPSLRRSPLIYSPLSPPLSSPHLLRHSSNIDINYNYNNNNNNNDNNTSSDRTTPTPTTPTTTTTTTTADDRLTDLESFMCSLPPAGGLGSYDIHTPSPPSTPFTINLDPLVTDTSTPNTPLTGNGGAYDDIFDCYTLQ